MAEPVLVFASFKPNAGKEKEVEEILRGMVAPTRQEPGNEVYDLYQKKGDDDADVSFHLFEKYADGAALEFHRGTDHYKNYRATIVDYLREPIHVIVLEGVDSLA